MNKKPLEPNERYLVIEALKRWRNNMQRDLERSWLINGKTTDSAKACKVELNEVTALIAKFEEEVL